MINIFEKEKESREYLNRDHIVSRNRNTVQHTQSSSVMDFCSTSEDRTVTPPVHELNPDNYIDTIKEL